MSRSASSVDLLAGDRRHRDDVGELAELRHREQLLGDRAACDAVSVLVTIATTGARSRASSAAMNRSPGPTRWSAGTQKPTTSTSASVAADDVVEPLAEQGPRPVQPRRVDEDELGVGAGQHAAHRVPGRLRLVAGDDDLAADERVGQRGLAGVGSPDEAAEAGAERHRATIFAVTRMTRRAAGGRSSAPPASRSRVRDRRTMAGCGRGRGGTGSAYGPDRSQFGELTRPANARHRGTVVIMHGGFWRARYDLALGRPLAADLAAHGYTCWNLEYRRVGDGGGWPATFDDVAAGIDQLADLDVDRRAVVAVGHSAGGHLAAWAAGRSALPADAPGAAPRVAVRGLVSQAGVLDLATAARQRRRRRRGPGPARRRAGRHARAYALADPIAAACPSPRRCCACTRGPTTTCRIAQSEAYVRAATAAGGTAGADREVAGRPLHADRPGVFRLGDRPSALPALLTGHLPS